MRISWSQQLYTSVDPWLQSISPLRISFNIALVESFFWQFLNNFKFSTDGRVQKDDLPAILFTYNMLLRHWKFAKGKTPLKIWKFHSQKKVFILWNLSWPHPKGIERSVLTVRDGITNTKMYLITRNRKGKQTSINNSACKKETLLGKLTNASFQFEIVSLEVEFFAFVKPNEDIIPVQELCTPPSISRLTFIFSLLTQLWFHPDFVKFIFIFAIFGLLTFRRFYNCLDGLAATPRTVQDAH